MLERIKIILSLPLRLPKFLHKFCANFAARFLLFLLANQDTVHAVLPLHMQAFALFLVLLLVDNLLSILFLVLFVFWAGVFSTKIVEEEMNIFDMYLFGIGAVFSTILFLSLISAIGHFVNEFLPSTLITIFNVLIGLVLITFGIKTALIKSSFNRV